VPHADVPDGRGIATIVFTDMVGSTALRVRLGEEQANQLRRIHDQRLAARIEANGGRVLRAQGDGLVAVFPVASAALTAAVEMQQAIASYNCRPDALAEIRVRMGLSVGEVSWEDGDCFGLPMVEAARLEAAARGAQILCSDLVRAMARGRAGPAFRPVGFLELKGLPELLAACEVVWEPEPDRAPLPLPSELAVRASWPFVGRTDELELAGRMIADHSRSRLGVLWLLGEPGIGKTRLATQIARNVHAGGGIVLFGRCNEDHPVPYQPFVEALSWHVAHLLDLELADRLGTAPAELTRLAPELEDRLGGLQPTRSTSPELEQHRLFEAVRTWLATAGAGRPLALVIDDVQWATRPTLALLRHVARSAEPSQALLVCTARTTSPDDSEALTALVEELDRRGAPNRRIDLTGLAPEAVRELVEAAAGPTLDDRLRRLVADVHSDTAGNPLFVEALLLDLTTKPDQRLPESHRTLAMTIGRRVARLPAEVADLLRTASVAGLDFDVRVAARAAGRDELSVLDVLEMAGRAGLVDEEGTDRYRFRHALVRSALREQLSRSRRVRVHVRVGEAVEAVYPDHLDEHAGELAHHFSQAVTVGGAPKALRYTLLAAERATHLLSHEEAVEAYGHALGLLDQVPGTHVLARYDLLIARSKAQRKAGDLLGALETLRAAAQEAAVHKAPEQLARAAVAFEETNFWLGSSGDPALELVEQAERALPAEESALRAVTVASLSRALDTSGRAEGTERGREARVMAEQLGDPVTSFAVLLRTTRSSLTVQEAHLSAPRWLELCKRAREIGDDDAYLLGLGQAMWATLMLGDLATSDNLFAEYSHLAAELRQPRWEYWLDLFRALRAVLAADLAAAERFVERAERIGERFGWAREGLYAVAMFLIRKEQGRLSALAPAVQAAVRLNPAASLWHPGLAALYAEMGRLEDARREFDAILSTGFGGLLAGSTRELCVSLLAEVCVALGDARRAPWFLEQLRLCEGRFLVSLASAVPLGPADRLLGMLASTAGRPDEAERWHCRGLELARHLRSPLWIAHCLYDYAVHLLPRDRSGAGMMLAQAAAICEEHGLPGLGQRVESLRAAN
jgi:class 3 adenylate cyclase